MEPVPAELKVITPFMQRAHECRNADKALHYWCIMYAAQLAMAAKPKEEDSTAYLLNLVDRLEKLREELKSNQAVTEEVAAHAYVENIALKVFTAADSEDRKGKATQKTARNFLVSSHFLELLNVFGQPESDIQEKVKYAQWKAVDISKALREGRVPHAGPIVDVDADEEAEAAEALAALIPPSDVSESTSGPSTTAPRSLSNSRGVNLDTPVDPRTLNAGPSEFGAPGEERTGIEPASPSYPFPATAPQVPSAPAAPSRPQPPPSAPTAPASFHAPQPPPSAPTVPAFTFEPKTVTQAQKHARWAISALDYDDFETAKKELRNALALIGG